MSDQGVRINLTEPVAIMTDARTIRALLALVQRIPMTDLEAVAVEDIFDRWFNQIADQQRRQQDALAAIANLAGRVPDQPPTLEEVAAQLDQISQIDQPEAGAAGDVLTHEGPPDNASGLVVNEAAFMRP